MSSSDEFDDLDNGLFDDAETLADLEARAVKSSQAPKRHIQPYKHVTATPKTAASRPTPQPPPKFGGRKEPGPINTEPRAGKGGFGWEYGGKRSMDGNVDRYLAQVNERQAYWGQGGSNNQDEETYPDVVMNEDGGYGIGVGEVVDTHSRPNIALAAPPKTEQQKKEEEEKRLQAAAARRAAIAQATDQSAVAGPGPTTARHFAKTTSVPLHQPQPRTFSANPRLLSRSTSAGHHPVSRPTSRGPGLSPIPSQSASQTPPLPASQGSLARKAALELDQERKKREAVETELQKLRAELEKQRRENEEHREREAMDIDVEEAGPAENKRDEGTEDEAETTRKIEALQASVWSAQGEAQQVRRLQEEERRRHIAEADRLRLQIADMEVKLKERDKEAARQVENIRTQAVFSNHAVHNSAFKPRAASQRPMPTPMRNGSPRGKSYEESFLLRTSLKGKGKAGPVTGPRFDTFNNAFAASPTVSRVKRQRTEPVIPNGSPSSPVKAVSPMVSPIRNRAVSERPEPVSPSPLFGDDIEMLPDDDLLDEAAPKASEADDSTDLKAELLYHIFNFIPPNRLQTTLDKDLYSTTGLYRILNHRPSPGSELVDRYGRSCNSLLQACGDKHSSFDVVLRLVAESLAECLDISSAHIRLETPTHCSLSEYVTTLNILYLLGTTAWLFKSFAVTVSAFVPNLPTMLADIAFEASRNRDQLEKLLGMSYHERSKALNPQPSQARERLTGTQLDLTYQRAIATAGPDRSAAESEVQDKEDRQKMTPEQQEIWFEELAYCIANLAEAMCWGGGDTDVWHGDELVKIVVGLTDPSLPVRIVVRCSNLIWSASAFRGNFRSLLVKSTKAPGEEPVLERISRLLLRPPRGASDEQMLQLTMTLIRALSMLSIADRDAILLIAQRSLVTPALIIVLRRLSSRLWGVYAHELDLQAHFEVVIHTLTLFHHLLFPHFPWPAIGPSMSQKAIPDHAEAANGVHGSTSPSKNGDDGRPQGVDLIARLKDPKINKEFNGLPHQFISALGVMAFGVPSYDISSLKLVDINDIQEMATEVLNVVVEGPEEDAVYELYNDDELSEEEKEKEKEKEMDNKAEDEVDVDAYEVAIIEHREEEDK